MSSYDCDHVYCPHRDPDTIRTSSNEAYEVVKQTEDTDVDGYVAVTTPHNIPPSTHQSSDPTAGGAVYEQVV